MQFRDTIAWHDSRLESMCRLFGGILAYLNQTLAWVGKKLSSKNPKKWKKLRNESKSLRKERFQEIKQTILMWPMPNDSPLKFAGQADAHSMILIH